MSEMVRSITPAGRSAEPLPSPPAGEGGRHRRSWAAIGLVAVILTAGATVSAWRAGVFPPAARSGAGRPDTPAAVTEPVRREDITATTPLSATLGYAGSYTVRGQGAGTLTWLPPAGQVVSQGQVLYRTDNGNPVVLLSGTVPAWRNLGEGLTGEDVTQLNHDLVALGDANSADIAALGWDYYSWETRVGVQQLEEHLGVSSPSGALPLGEVVFEPVAIRVTRVTGHLGGRAAGPVLAGTSDRHVVTISLAVSQESEVKTGDRVSITLPGGTTTPGTVTSVGTVATTNPGGPGQSPTTTVTVDVGLTDPSAAGTLDQAPVTVNVTTASAANVLVVPVTALLAHAPSGYQVEVVGPGDSRRDVPVRVGIFDDADGMVQVSGALTPGQRVVVAAT